MTTQMSLSNLKGLDEYLEKLAKMAENFPEICAEAVMLGAEIVQDGMVQLVPVDTGNLLAHIQVTGVRKAGTYVFTEVGVIHEIAYTDAETARYGNVIEYGSPRVAAQPYIRPGFSGSKRQALKAMKDFLQEKTGLFK